MRTSTPSTTPMPVTTLAPTGKSVPRPAGRQLEERTVAIEQEFDALTNGELASGTMPSQGALPAPGVGLLALGCEFCQALQQRGSVGGPAVGQAFHNAALPEAETELRGTLLTTG